ncbi:MAG: PKD domain-containing protein [Bacteroidetes bacterium]|nr:PKD domain-containing protein [Bacteroidota bacterium]
MKTIYTAVALLLLLPFGLLAQVPIWQKADTTSKGGNITQSKFTRDQQGNQYFVGTFTGSIRFGSASLSATSQDAFIAKINPSGKHIWAKKIGGNSQVTGLCTVVDTAGNVYVAGDFFNNITINGSSINSTGSTDGYLIKFDKNGSYVWHRLITGTSIQQVTSLTIDGAGSVFIAGNYFGSSNIAGKSISNSSSGYDCYMAKITSMGHTSWVRAFGGSSTDQVKDMASDGNKSILITGNFFSSISFGSTTVNGSGSWDIYVARYDSAGKLGWAIAGGSTNVDQPTAISWDNNGGFILAGTFSTATSMGGKTLSGSFNESFICQFNGNARSTYLVRLPKSTGFGMNNINGVAPGSNGSAIITGNYSESLTINNKTYNPTSGDIYVIGISKNGVFDWINTASGNGTETATGIYVDPNDRYYISGIIGNLTDFGSIKVRTTGSAIYYAQGLPPITKPDYKGTKNVYVYFDSTITRKYDLNIKAQTEYNLIAAPSGLVYDSSTVSITWKPTINDLGRHRVRISATNLAGTDTAEINIWVIQRASATIVAPTAICIGDTANISYQAPDAGPLTYLWEFSDGSDFIKTSIDYVFNKTGNFELRLWTRNVFGHDDTFYHYIGVFPAPNAGFKMNSACAKDTLVLTDKSTSPMSTIVSQKWYIENNLVGTGNQLKRYFSNDTLANFSLVIETAAGCIDSFSKSTQVYGPPKVDFVLFDACEGAEALFFDQTKTADTVTKYTWDFGDNTVKTITYTGLAHTYKSTGEFNVTLTLETKSNCTATATKKITIAPKPTAKFSVGHVCGNSPYEFRDSSTTPTGTIRTRIWDFGDGKFSQKKNVSHQYNKAGTYQVSLIVSATNSCIDTLTLPITILPSPKPTIKASNLCANGLAKFVSQTNVATTDKIISQEWFVNGKATSVNDNELRINLSNSDATYSVVQKIETLKGCVDSNEIKVSPRPYVSSEFSVEKACIGDTVEIKNQLDSNTLLDSVYFIGWGVQAFNDGNGWKAAFTSPKGHQLFMRTFAKNGCNDSTAKQLETFAFPNAEFTFTRNSVKELSFTSVPNGNSYFWDFGDGEITSAENPTHTFSDYGTYTVSLTVTNSEGCSWTTSQEIKVDQTISISEQELALSIYPNPTNGAFNLQVSGTENAQLFIFDIAGKLVYNEQIVAETTWIQPGLQSGSYLVKVAGNGTITQTVLLVE